MSGMRNTSGHQLGKTPSDFGLVIGTLGLLFGQCKSQIAISSVRLRVGIFSLYGGFCCKPSLGYCGKNGASWVGSGHFLGRRLRASAELGS
jgi:hypothetical protein